MGKSGCRSASHQQFKDKAKTRVDDLQGMFTDLQSARKESRTVDVAILEEQVNQMLREWKAELNDATPASSLLGNSHISSDLSSEIRRLLQLTEEQDDATSKLAELPPMSPKPEPLDAPNPDTAGVHGGETAYFQEEYYLGHELQEHVSLGVDEYQRSIPTESHHITVNCLEGTTHFEYQQFDLHQELPPNQFLGYNTGGHNSGDGVSLMSDLLPTISPPASAFLRPKCALWDCPRPAQGSDWCQDYCSSFHATLAFNECPPGMAPVLRPGGIDLKDGPLFAALGAKTQGKNVGIPDCEGAATKKSPWNAPDLFDLSVLENETIREWLFFDKPRRAFESGSRKQRSLPDYKGRGWHESRKQVMKDFGGLKRNYYMDPQPSEYFEWHLYEYEINGCDLVALYRLELKVVDAKKSAKTRVTSDSLVDLQHQMGRLNAENASESKRCVKGRAKVNQDRNEKFSSASDVVRQEGGDDAQNVYDATNQMAPVNESSAYGPSLPPYVYSLESLNTYYGT